MPAAASIAAPAKPKMPGVALLATRPYIAGQIIKRHGLAAGVTDAMVAELDAAYAAGKKPNPTQSKFDLQSAWQATRGFTTGNPRQPSSSPQHSPRRYPVAAWGCCSLLLRPTPAQGTGNATSHVTGADVGLW